VGKVDAFTVAGLYLWFNSNDHLPPHFHAEKSNEWEVIVRFLRDPSEMIEVQWQLRSPGGAMLKKLRSAAEEHREVLLVEWEKKVLVNTPGAGE
jgi:hypothetical protein